MRAILLPASRHCKSSRGTPRLRRLPRTLHGALRLAAWTTRLGSWPRFLAGPPAAQPGLTFSLTHPGSDLLAPSVLFHPLVASGGFIVRLDWPALTPALTEIRLFVPTLGSVCRACTSCRAGIRGLAASWLFNSRRQAHFLLEHHKADSVLPNVRAKLATTAWRAGQAAQNGAKPQRRMTSVTCRWRSA